MPELYGIITEVFDSNGHPIAYDYSKQKDTLQNSSLFMSETYLGWYADGICTTGYYEDEISDFYDTIQELSDMEVKRINLLDSININGEV